MESVPSDNDGDEGREGFEAALNELLREADDDGVDVVGAWHCDRDDDGGWEILISEVVTDGGDA